MVANTSATNGATYIKVANVAGLYRHSRSGRYYGAKKISGKRRDVSLRTTDRQIAGRRMRDWVRNIDRVDHEKERTTFAELINIFVATNRGKSKSTQTNHSSIIKLLGQTWRPGLDIEVREFVRLIWMNG